jgi:hypothetical protein
MTFLQPFVLWALPLALLPVIIHLVNRMRHRPQRWAAMRFLLAATQSSSSHAKLRQWLILALRVAAALMLIFFLGRPLAGGWVGWALAPAPDTIFILFDRSASMEGKAAGVNTSKREEALRLLSQAARPYNEKSHIVLLDSATKVPQEIANVSLLPTNPSAAPTDTAADLPGLLQTALTWLIENKSGTAEIWIASDFQKSNWSPLDSRWVGLSCQITALPQKIRIRLLELSGAPDLNRSIALKDAMRGKNGLKSQLRLVFDLQQSPAATETVHISAGLEGAESLTDVTIENGALRWRQRLPLDPAKANGWGAYRLPQDSNPRDNSAYFVFGPEVKRNAFISSENQKARAILHLATGTTAAVGSDTSTDPEHWRESSLIVWQKPLPSGTIADALKAFADQGGTVIFFPPDTEASTNLFEGRSWGAIESAAIDQSFQIPKWTEEDGPLAKTDEGFSLPVRDLVISKRRVLSGATNSLAAYSDGRPFLTRATLGRGEIYFCTSLPLPEWSSLADGPVLVPMLQRLLDAGAKRLQQSSMIATGELTPQDAKLPWRSLTTGATDPRIHAGVYTANDRLLAINRPAIEDDPEILDPGEARKLFGVSGVETFLQPSKRSERFEGEIWRVFLFSMMAALLFEGWLILPPRDRTPSTDTPRKTPKPREMETVA